MSGGAWVGIAFAAMYVAGFVWCCWDFWRIVQRDTAGSREAGRVECPRCHGSGSVPERKSGEGMA